MTEDQKIEANKKHWNKAFHDFKGWCALPTWGPFEIGKDDPTLIGEIQGKTFVEICCGSGHSVKYLLDNGAKKVYGLDFSEEQLNLASELNKKYIIEGKAEFFKQAMEDDLNLPGQVDTVFSIYGMPWTVNVKQTLKNIFSYLKPGGRFIWSWDHTIFKNSKVDDEQVVIEYDYHDEDEILRMSNSIEDSVYNITTRKISTWFMLLRESGFEVSRYLEPEPVNLDEDISNISSPEMATYYDLKKLKKLPCVMIFDCIKR